MSWNDTGITFRLIERDQQSGEMDCGTVVLGVGRTLEIWPQGRDRGLEDGGPCPVMITVLEDGTADVIVWSERIAHAVPAPTAPTSSAWRRVLARIGL